MADSVVEVLLRARADMSQVVGSISDLQRQFQKLELPKNISGNLDKSFAKLTPLIKEYQKQLNKQSFSPKDVKNLEILKGKIESVYSEILGETQKVNSEEIKLKADVTQLEKAKKSVTDYKNELQKAMQTINSKISGKNFGHELDKILNVKGIGRTNFSSLIGQAKNYLNTQQFQEYNNVIDQMRNKMLSLTTTKYSFAESLGVKDAEKHIEQAEKKIQSFFKNIRLNDSNVTSINNLRQQLAGAEAELERLNFSSIDKGSKAFENAKSRVEQLRQALAQVDSTAQPAALSMSRMQSELQSLQTSTQYFFGLRNMFNLLKRGVREALDTVKELDAAMTETAVVTQFSVSDMWGDLPKYTKLANELGATTQGAYETMTLYYQQGLNQEQAFALGAETMKMARIAGLDYAKTTDMMTAALRGFNMELNETSAKRINDVYSKLAAVTASDTEELGTAMQRTASIAHSAGMSFEGTTAFLAQAIETTREPAENIGTAMKTIVARFQEMKKNPLEMTEVDGEEVDYNKVDAALKTIGVDLKDTNGQFRELDQVFLDISKHWEGLSQTQQRYIATIAAGSRQQSRFIAMMDNYERTMQLMDAAKNSEGASDAQFDKTLESLESKLNKLQNAWKEFLMGITDSNLFKGVVDGLTSTFNIVNTLLDKISLGKGVVKSFLSLFIAFKTLSVGGRLVNNFIGGLGGVLTGAGFVGGYRQAAGRYNAGSQGVDTTMAGRISTPIVAKLDQVIAAIKGQKIAGEKYSTLGDYKKAQADFYTVGTKNSSFKNMKDAFSIFDELSDKHGQAVLANAPGSVATLKRSSKDWFGQVAKQLNLDTKSQKLGKQFIDGIYKGMSKGQISPKEGKELIGKPELWGDYFGTEVARNFSASFSKTKTDFYKQQQKAVKQQTKAARIEQAKAIRKQAWIDAGGDPHASDALKTVQLRNNKELSQRYTAAYKKRHSGYLKKINEQEVSPQLKVEKLANNVGQLGSKFTNAGFSVQMFGQQLAMLSPALAGVGNAITIVGSGITTLGMSISGIGKAASMISTLVTTFGGLAGFLPIILAIGAAVGALVYDFKKTQDIKNDAKAIVDNFNKIDKSTSENINNLKQWQQEMNSLSKGVDKNGNNVSLDIADYDRYRELVDKIAEINPEIVQGYNAQGDAIIDNNNSLAETLALQEQIRREATAKYTSNSSIDKLIRARDINENLFEKIKGDMLGGTKTKATYSKLAHNLKGQINWNKLEQQLGFDFKEATEYTLTRNYKKIEKAIKSQLGDNISTNISNSLDDFIEAEENRVKETEDIYKALSIYAKQQKYTSLVPEELLNDYESLLREQAATAPDARAAKDFAAITARQMKHLGGTNSPVGKLFKELKDEQEAFNKDFNTDKYNEAIETTTDKLEALSEAYRKSGSETQRAYADVIDNMIAKAKAYASEGGEALTKSFDTTKTAIDTLSSAYDDFKKSVESGTLEKASSSLKSIYDEMYSGTNAEWGGNGTYWKGARNFVSEETFRSGDFNKTDAIMKMLAPALEDTKEGYQAAYNIIHDTAQQLANLDESSPFYKYKDVLTINDDGGIDVNLTDEDALEGMSNFKGISPDMWRFIFAKIARTSDGLTTFDPQLLRASYIGDERVSLVKNKDNEEGTVYIKKSEFENDLLASDVSPGDWEHIEEEANKNGIEFLPDKLIDEKTEKIGKGIQKNLEQAGINADNYMSELIKKGYEEEEILQYGKELTGKDEETLKEEYDQAFLEETDAALANINDNASQAVALLDSINSALGGGKVGEGTATDSDFLGNALLKNTFGGSGNDTEIEKIHEGEGKYSGEELSPSTYKNAKKDLEEQVSSSMDYLHEVREGLKKAIENNDIEQIEKYTKEEETAKKVYNYQAEALSNLHKTWGEVSGETTISPFYPEYYYEQRYDPNILNRVGSLWDLLENGSYFGPFSRTNNDNNNNNNNNNKNDNNNDNNNDSHFSIIDSLHKLAGSLLDNTEYYTESPGGLNATAGRHNVLRSLIEALYNNTNSNEQNTKTVQDNTNNNPFGNTNINNRQKLQWGENPASNPNFSAAASWGWTEDDLRNSVSTYMSSGLSIQDATGTIELAVTPMLQGEDGTPQVLSQDTVQQYLNTIAEQATNESGEIDFNELMKIDKKGVEIEGQQIHDLLMGAFRGENAVDEVNALGILEHGIEETKNTTVTGVNEITQALISSIQKTKEAQQGIDNLLDSGSENPAVPHQQAPGMPSNAAPNVENTHATVEFNTEQSQSKIQSLYDLLGITIDEANQGATFDIDVSGDKDLNKASKAAEKLSKLSGTQTFSVQAGDLDTGNIEASKKNLGSDVNIPVHATDYATAEINTYRSGFNLTGVSIPLDVSITGTRNFTVTVNRAAKGMNNALRHFSLPSFGAAAKGSKYGRVGPKGKGGLTLTGEEGYEIAWLPNENRSMILGAKGPQLIDLPSNAVVWTHEQSEKIIKQKSIPAGSHAKDSVYVKGTVTSPFATTTTTTTTTTPPPKDTSKDIDKDIKDTTTKIKKVSVYWQNIGLKIEATQRRAERNQKEYEKYLAKLQATLKSTGTEGKGDNFIKNTTALKNYGQSELKQAQKNLKKLDKTNKKIKVSYTKNGKTTSGKVKIGTYVKYDKKSDSYIIDEKKLNRKKTGSKSKRKGIRDAIEKEIQNRQNKVKDAQELIDKSTESLEEFSKKLYETFFAWETELTKIWTITQKINSATSKIERLKSFDSLMETKFDAEGAGSNPNYLKDSLNFFKQQLRLQDDLINQRQNAIIESKNAVNNAIDLTEVSKNLAVVRNRLKNEKLNKTEKAGLKEYEQELLKQLTVKTTAQKYAKITQYKDGTVKVEFDYDKLIADKNKGIITTDLKEEIEKYINNIVDNSNKLNEAYNNLTSDLNSLYQQLEDLNKTQVDASMELLNTYEDSEKKKINKLKTLSDNLSKAFKNLIDQVKKRLDERRKQEDNIKTEQDLSKKQQRLSMLKADTAGGHAVEIAQLEQEIAEAQQTYQRTLEDQVLERIENQVDEAYKQRERQIELQEQLLDATNNASLVNYWMANPTAEGVKEQMLEAYRQANNYEDVTALKQQDIDDNFEKLYDGIVNYETKRAEIQTSITSAKDALEELRQAIADNSKILREINGSNNTNNSNNTATNQNNSKENSSTQVKADKKSLDTYLNKYNEAVTAKRNGKKFGWIDDGSKASKYYTKLLEYSANGKLSDKELTNLISYGKAIGYSVKRVVSDLAKTDELTWVDIIKAAKKAKFSKNEVKTWGSSSAFTKAFNDWSKYATGGLADYTGPAWLDGTPSKPELVLNAQDTKNFIALKDVLSKAIGSTSSVENTSNNATFEININVDHLNNDYDVDKVVERVKKKIVQDSSYRNVTQVRKFR